MVITAHLAGRVRSATQERVCGACLSPSKESQLRQTYFVLRTFELCANLALPRCLSQSVNTSCFCMVSCSRFSSCEKRRVYARFSARPRPHFCNCNITCGAWIPTAHRPPCSSTRDMPDASMPRKSVASFFVFGLHDTVVMPTAASSACANPFLLEE